MLTKNIRFYYQDQLEFILTQLSSPHDLPLSVHARFRVHKTHELEESASSVPELLLIDKTYAKRQKQERQAQSGKPSSKQGFVYDSLGVLCVEWTCAGELLTLTHRSYDTGQKVKFNVMRNPLSTMERKPWEMHGPYGRVTRENRIPARYGIHSCDGCESKMPQLIIQPYAPLFNNRMPPKKEELKP